MKIEFDSRAEIQRLAAVLEDGIYPAPIIIDVEDLVDACGAQEDVPLPWNTDGFRVPLRIDKVVNKMVDKRGDKLGNKAAEKMASKRGQKNSGGVWCDGGSRVPHQGWIVPTVVVELCCTWDNTD